MEMTLMGLSGPSFPLAGWQGIVSIFVGETSSADSSKYPTRPLTCGFGLMSLMPVKASHQDMKTPDARSMGAQDGSGRPTRSASVCGLACLHRYNEKNKNIVETLGKTKKKRTKQDRTEQNKATNTME